jgi:hypothetical protein
VTTPALAGLSWALTCPNCMVEDEEGACPLCGRLLVLPRKQSGPEPHSEGDGARGRANQEDK